MASLTRQQKEHLLQWLLMVLPGEVMVLRYPGSSRFLLRMAGVSFLAGGWLRLLGCYPGKPEPLALDFVSGFLAFSLAGFPRSKKGAGFLLPAVILPHLLYILSQPELGPAGWRRFLRKRRSK